MAAHKGDPRVVSRFISAGQSVAKPNYGGMQPLHLACMRDHVDVTRILVNAGSDVHKSNLLGLSPLHYAARYKTTQILGYLLTFDMDLNTRTTNGSSALHLAAQYDNAAAASALLEAGVDPDLKDNHTLSPLKIAVSNKNVEIARLLRPISDINWQTPTEVHILFRAFQTRDCDTATLVLSTMKSSLTNKQFRKVVRNMIPELLAELLADTESSVEVCKILLPHLPKKDNVRYLLGYQLLMSFIKHSGESETIEALLQIDPVISQQVTRGNWCLLFSACKHGRKDTVKMLLHYGAKGSKNYQTRARQFSR